MQVDVGIGDTFRINEKQYCVVEDNQGDRRCLKCALIDLRLHCYYMACSEALRWDKKDVHFEEVEP